MDPLPITWAGWQARAAALVADGVRAVRLTTWPEHDLAGRGGQLFVRLPGGNWHPAAGLGPDFPAGGRWLLALLRERWPGVTFTLPDRPPAVTNRPPAI
jgi:hypothetical protein